MAPLGWSYYNYSRIHYEILIIFVNHMVLKYIYIYIYVYVYACDLHIVCTSIEDI